MKQFSGKGAVVKVGELVESSELPYLFVYVAFDRPVPTGSNFDPKLGVKCRFEGQQVFALKQLLSPGLSIALSGAWNLVDGSAYELVVSHVDLDITDKNYSKNVQELLS